jgi:hypothetical protein
VGKINTRQFSEQALVVTLFPRNRSRNRPFEPPESRSAKTAFPPCSQHISQFFPWKCRLFNPAFAHGQSCGLTAKK